MDIDNLIIYINYDSDLSAESMDGPRRSGGKDENMGIEFPTEFKVSKDGNGIYQRTGNTDALHPGLLVSLKMRVEKYGLAQVPLLLPSSESQVSLFRGIHKENKAIQINVSVDLLENEINPADWLELWLEDNGHAMEASRRIPNPSGEIGDFLSSFSENGDDYIARSLPSQ